MDEKNATKIEQHLRIIAEHLGEIAEALKQIAIKTPVSAGRPTPLPTTS